MSLVSRTKNRHGHWVCWMSTGKRYGLTWRTHTHTMGPHTPHYPSKPLARWGITIQGSQQLIPFARKKRTGNTGNRISVANASRSLQRQVSTYSPGVQPGVSHTESIFVSPSLDMKSSMNYIMLKLECNYVFLSPRGINLLENLEIEQARPTHHAACKGKFRLIFRT